MLHSLLYVGGYDPQVFKNCVLESLRALIGNKVRFCYFVVFIFVMIFIQMMLIGLDTLCNRNPV